MQHLALSVLWAFRSRKEILSSEAVKHLADCEDCMIVLGICQTSQSLEQATWRLNEQIRTILESREDGRSLN
jgi:hypothetical protein